MLICPIGKRLGNKPIGGWLLILCALLGFLLAPVGSLDWLASAHANAAIPEEDDTGSGSEGVSITSVVHTQRAFRAARSAKASTTHRHLSAHTPTAAFHTSHFRLSPDNMRNGLGTPRRC